MLFAQSFTVVMKILVPKTQTAHLVFADTKSNAQKPKELFFDNAERQEMK